MADFKFDTTLVTGRPGYKLSFLSILKGAGNTMLPSVTFVAADVQIVIYHGGVWVLRNITTPPVSIGSSAIYNFNLSAADLLSDSPDKPIGIYINKTVGADTALGFISIDNPLVDSNIGLMSAMQEILSYCTGVVARDLVSGKNSYTDRSGGLLFSLTPTLPARLREEGLPPIPPEAPSMASHIQYYTQLGETISMIGEAAL